MVMSRRTSASLLSMARLLPMPSEKVVGGQHCAIVLQLGAGTVVHPVELVLAGDPGCPEAGQTTGVLGSIWGGTRR